VQHLLLRLGKRIRSLRKDRGWTQEELAHRSGLNRSYMSDVECGRSDLSLSTLQKIARPLGISVAELLTGVG
jgi:transcriptional regulator with XRE-family HTH domain